jgi:membrane protease YdiL (CAAX protease family)
MSSFVRRRPFLSYYLVALAIALAVILVAGVVQALDPPSARAMPDLFAWIAANRLYVNALTIGRFAVTEQPLVLLILAFASAPSLSAIIVTALGTGRPGLARLFGRFRPWATAADRSRALWTYGLMIGAYLAGILLYIGLIDELGTAKMTAHAATVFGAGPLAIGFTLLIGPFIDEGGTLEELGWRGFALPILLQRFRSPLVASIILGLLWTAWHLPREIPVLLGGTNLGSFFAAQAYFALLCVALSIVATWLVNRTGGSILPAIMLHGGANVWTKALGDAQTLADFDVRTGIVVGAAILIIIFTGPSLGRRATPAEVPA